VVARTVFSVARRLECVRFFIERNFLNLKNLSLFALNQVFSVTDAVLEDVLELDEDKFRADIGGHVFDDLDALLLEEANEFL
jgi:hypothetical protein